MSRTLVKRVSRIVGPSRLAPRVPSHVRHDGHSDGRGPSRLRNASDLRGSRHCHMPGASVQPWSSVLRRLDRVLLPGHRREHMPSWNGRGRLVEGRRLGVLHYRRAAPSVLHRLQSRLRPWVRVRLERDVQQGLYLGAVLVRRRLRHPPGGLRAVPLRPVQPGRVRRKDQVSRRHLRAPVALGPVLPKRAGAERRGDPRARPSLPARRLHRRATQGLLRRGGGVDDGRGHHRGPDQRPVRAGRTGSAGPVRHLSLALRGAAGAVAPQRIRRCSGRLVLRGGRGLDGGEQDYRRFGTPEVRLVGTRLAGPSHHVPASSGRLAAADIGTLASRAGFVRG